MPKDKSKIKEIKELKNKLKKVKKSKVKKSKPKSTKGLTKKQIIELKLKEYMANLLPQSKGGGGGGFEQKPVEVAKGLPNASTSSLLHSNLIQSDKADALREMTNQVSNLKKEIADKKDVDSKMLALIPQKSRDGTLSQRDYENLSRMHGKLFNNIDQRFASAGNLVSDKIDVLNHYNERNNRNIEYAISDLKKNKNPTYSSLSYDENSRFSQNTPDLSSSLRDYYPQVSMNRFFKPEVAKDLPEYATASSSSSSQDVSNDSQEITKDLPEVANDSQSLFRQISDVASQIQDEANAEISDAIPLDSNAMSSELDNMLSHNEQLNIDDKGMASLKATDILSDNRGQDKNDLPDVGKGLHMQTFSNSRDLPSNEAIAQNIVSDKLNSSFRLPINNEQIQHNRIIQLREEAKYREDEEIRNKERNVNKLESENRKKSLKKPIQIVHEPVEESNALQALPTIKYNPLSKKMLALDSDTERLKQLLMDANVDGIDYLLKGVKKTTKVLKSNNQFNTNVLNSLIDRYGIVILNSDGENINDRVNSKTQVKHILKHLEKK